MSYAQCDGRRQVVLRERRDRNAHRVRSRVRRQLLELGTPGAFPSPGAINASSLRPAATRPRMFPGPSTPIRRSGPPGDIFAVMDACGLDAAHLVGLSMGGFAVLHAALQQPRRVRSLVAAGTGYGAQKAHEAYFRSVSEEVAAGFDSGVKSFAEIYAEGASRVQFQTKDPAGWRIFAGRLAGHSAARRGQHHARSPGAATFALRSRGRACPDFGPRTHRVRRRGRPLPAAWHLPEADHSRQRSRGFFRRAGHTINLEEPALFNRLLTEFLVAVRG